MRSRVAGEMCRAYQTLIDRLKESGIRPTMHILDNECSAEFKTLINKNEMKYQLVPPHDHRRNVAEKAIQTFKDHFVAVLCGTDDSFPLQLWCQILRQAEHQLNMLRKSRTDPTISAFEQMHGKHNFDAHLWAVLVSAVELHVIPKTGRRGKHTPNRASILAPRGSITVATKCGYGKPNQKGLVRQFFSSTHT